ncbi:MAG: ComEA family DNA-binding protein [Thiolinea sp.]
MKKILSALLVSASLFATPALLADMVNINTATAAALQENLKGVGEKKAQAIVAYRKEYGEFKTLDEIMEVKGIGKGIFKKIRDDISLDKGISSLSGAQTPKPSTNKVITKPVKDKTVGKSKKSLDKDQKAEKTDKSSEKLKAS